MRVVDFFCGAGGFSEGFRQAGHELVLAVDKWEPAVTTYKGNNLGANVILDDIIRISYLNDDEFNNIVPDSEIIIGSPPCQSFSNSNKSGNADKTLGILLIEAYLRIIARKKYKSDSILKYWILENVPNVQYFIKSEYSAADLGLKGDFVLSTQGESSGVYNAKYFGAPTNRKRYFCGEFPTPQPICSDKTLITLNDVLTSLGSPLDENGIVFDVNYPELYLARSEVTDHHYIQQLADFEIETARRLKQDKGYMGRMAFPENRNKPARTVMATLSPSSREAMILEYDNDKYRLPTVREVASMMSFPIEYQFYGCSKAMKQMLVGNAVPPKLSYALAIAIANECGETIPQHYLPVERDETIEFINLNGKEYPLNTEKPKRYISKFKYHIPYLIINRYRVELTNYHSDFDSQNFLWDAEIHYSQGKGKAAIFTPDIPWSSIKAYQENINIFINDIQPKLLSNNDFQAAFCMTKSDRMIREIMGPYELLDEVKEFIVNILTQQEMNQMINIDSNPFQLPLAILLGYYLLKQFTVYMRGLDNGCCNTKARTCKN